MTRRSCRLCRWSREALRAIRSDRNSLAPLPSRRDGVRLANTNCRVDPGRPPRSREDTNTAGPGPRRRCKVRSSHPPPRRQATADERWCCACRKGSNRAGWVTTRCVGSRVDRYPQKSACHPACARTGCARCAGRVRALPRSLEEAVPSFPLRATDERPRA